VAVRAGGRGDRDARQVLWGRGPIAGPQALPPVVAGRAVVGCLVEWVNGLPDRGIVAHVAPEFEGSSCGRRLPDVVHDVLALVTAVRARHQIAGGSVKQVIGNGDVLISARLGGLAVIVQDIGRKRFDIIEQPRLGAVRPLDDGVVDDPAGPAELNPAANQGRIPVRPVGARGVVEPGVGQCLRSTHLEQVIEHVDVLGPDVGFGPGGTASLLLEMEATEEARPLLELCAGSKSVFISEWAQGVLALIQANRKIS